MPKTFSQYIHVDNGGYTIGISIPEESERQKACTYIFVEDGYYGYSNHSMRFYEKITPENLRKIGMQFLRAADEIEKCGGPINIKCAE